MMHPNRHEDDAVDESRRHHHSSKVDTTKGTREEGEEVEPQQAKWRVGAAGWRLLPSDESETQPPPHQQLQKQRPNGIPHNRGGGSTALTTATAIAPPLREGEEGERVPRGRAATARLGGVHTFQATNICFGCHHEQHLAQKRHVQWGLSGTVGRDQRPSSCAEHVP